MTEFERLMQESIFTVVHLFSVSKKNLASVCKTWIKKIIKIYQDCATEMEQPSSLMKVHDGRNLPTHNFNSSLNSLRISQRNGAVAFFS